MQTPISETDFSELKLLKRGKVRDVYDLGEYLLMVVSDRISAFDVVMPDPVPDKGIILTQISLFWFDVVKPLIQNHVVAHDVDQYPDSCRAYADALQGRSMLVKKAEPLPIECIVRGYISGSGWKEYTETGSICGIQLPAGLKESQKLPEPIFTPSTKAEHGEHDINIISSRQPSLSVKQERKRFGSSALISTKKEPNSPIKKALLLPTPNLNLVWLTMMLS